MEYALLVLATPLAVWVADRWLCRGEFVGLVVGAIGEERARRAKRHRLRP